MSLKLHFRRVPSLIELCINYVTQHLSKIDISIIQSLPEHLKDRILRKFTTRAILWREVNFSQILRALAHRNTKHIDLTTYVVDDEILDIIKICQNMSKLHLSSLLDHKMTSKGLLSTIPNFSKLKLLQLTNCSAVNDDVIECIAKHCLCLNSLDLDGCKNISNESLYFLTPLKHLLWLTFSRTQIQNSGIESLVKGPSGSKLKELRITKCPNLDETVLKVIANNCTELEVLSFFNCNKVKDHTYFLFGEGNLKNLKQFEWAIEW